MKTGTTCEAFDGKSWRIARINEVTPKSENYPNGGYYVQWMDVDPSNRRVSKCGWQPSHLVREIANPNSALAEIRKQNPTQNIPSGAEMAAMLKRRYSVRPDPEIGTCSACGKVGVAIDCFGVCESCG